MRFEFVHVPDLDKHISREQAVPCLLGDHTYMGLVLGIGTCATILYINFFAL